MENNNKQHTETRQERVNAAIEAVRQVLIEHPYVIIRDFAVEPRNEFEYARDGDTIFTSIYEANTFVQKTAGREIRIMNPYAVILFDDCGNMPPIRPNTQAERMRKTSLVR